MVAAAATGAMFCNNIIPKHLESIIAKMTEIGADITTFDEWYVRMPDRAQCNINPATSRSPICSPRLPLCFLFATVQHCYRGCVGQPLPLCRAA